MIGTDRRRAGRQLQLRQRRLVRQWQRLQWLHRCDRLPGVRAGDVRSRDHCVLVLADLRRLIQRVL